MADTQPKLAAVNSVHLDISENGQHAEATVGSDGFSLKLSPKLAEQVGRWVYRAITLAALGYLALGGFIPSKTQTDNLDKRLTAVEANLSTLLKHFNLEEAKP